jgi:septal ring factor EnvC (AmiA/AmiB activator)
VVLSKEEKKDLIAATREELKALKNDLQTTKGSIKRLEAEKKASEKILANVKKAIISQTAKLAALKG